MMVEMLTRLYETGFGAVFPARPNGMNVIMGRFGPVIRCAADGYDIYRSSIAIGEDWEMPVVFGATTVEPGWVIAEGDFVAAMALFQGHRSQALPDPVAIEA